MSKPIRILVVEDSETQALLLQATLEEQGWEVIHAYTASRRSSGSIKAYPTC